MKTRLIILCSAALLSTAALAEDNPDAKRSSGETFKMLDTDGDGKISKSEAAVDEHLANSFDKLDGNSDGFVTKREWQRNTMPRMKPGP